MKLPQMKNFLLACLITTNSFAMAQNLISNPGFELNQKLPEKDGCFNDYIRDWSNLNGKKGYPNATPDYLHENGTGAGKVSDYYFGVVKPHSGDAMMGVIVMPRRNFYEYVSTQVSVKEGKRYEFSMWVTNGKPKYCGNSGKGFGIHFSSSLPPQEVAEFVDVKPHWTITDDFHTNKWEQIRFRFTAPEAYDHLTIGYFNSPESIEMKPAPEGSNQSDCIYFFVDDISLKEVDDNDAGLVNLDLPESVRNVNSKLGEILAKPPVLAVKVSVKDNGTGNDLPAAISIVDLASNEVIMEGVLDNEKKEFFFNVPNPGLRYGLFAKTAGYVEGSERIEPVNILKDSLIGREIRLSPIKKGEKIILKNIYFDTGKYELLPSSFAELEKLASLMKENPDLKIEISGHTDSQGTDESNQILSENRAKSVYEYLAVKVGKTRMTFKGYGEASPIQTNETAQGRQENRRVEFKIL